MVAASDAVKRPVYIPNIINKGKGISKIASLVADIASFKSNFSVLTPPENKVTTTEYIKKIRMVVSPGIRPAINISLTGACDITPYNMIGKDGGNRSPIEPVAVMIPREKISEYPAFLKIGKSNPPRATIVTPEAPVRAVNIEVAISTTSGTPPGNQPTQAFVNLKSL
jgi:hypothetical protein